MRSLLSRLIEDVIGRHCSALPLLDSRHPNEILGFDKDGEILGYIERATASIRTDPSAALVRGVREAR